METSKPPAEDIERTPEDCDAPDVMCCAHYFPWDGEMLCLECGRDPVKPPPALEAAKHSDSDPD